MYIATLRSEAAPKEARDWPPPTPRITTLGAASPYTLGEIARLGTYSANSRTLTTCRSEIVSELIAVTDTAVSCRSDSRRSAVTTTSSRAVVVVCANAVLDRAAADNRPEPATRSQGRL